jgi:hypothetical protein
LLNKSIWFKLVSPNVILYAERECQWN